MNKIVKPSRARLEFEAVKGLAKDSFNEGLFFMSFMGLISLFVLMTCISGKLITFATATLVVLSGFFIALYVLGEFKLIYPLRFRILYRK